MTATHNTPPLPRATVWFDYVVLCGCFVTHACLCACACVCVVSVFVPQGDVADYFEDDFDYGDDCGGGFDLFDTTSGDHDHSVDSLSARRSSAGSTASSTLAAAPAAQASSSSSSSSSRFQALVAGPPGGGEATAAAALCDAVAHSSAGPNAEYSYFDAARLTRLHHWAGPAHAHWKPARRAGGGAGEGRGVGGGTEGGAGDASSVSAAAAAGQHKRGGKRTKKPKFVLDFFAPPVDTATQFAPPPRSATATQLTTASLAKAAANASNLLLPEDHGYKLSDLLKLACKPDKTLVLRRAPQGAHASAVPHAAEDLVPMEVQLDDVDSTDDMAFDFGGDDVGGGDDFADDDGVGFALASHEPSMDGLLVDKADRVGKIDIQYSRVAKKVGLACLRLGGGGGGIAVVLARNALTALCCGRTQVDVKQLKENIWDFVSSGCDPAASANDESKADQQDTEQADAPVDGVSFQDTVQALAPQAPATITVPFYFICMLHLANERGLALEGSDDLTDFHVSKDTSVEMAS